MASESIYMQVIKQLKSEGRIEVFSEEQNFELLQELNEGMEDFVNEQKVLERESEMELAGIIIA